MRACEALDLDLTFITEQPCRITRWLLRKGKNFLSCIGNKITCKIQKINLSNWTSLLAKFKSSIYSEFYTTTRHLVLWWFKIFCDVHVISLASYITLFRSVVLCSCAREGRKLAAACVDEDGQKAKKVELPGQLEDGRWELLLSSCANEQ
jgi:hypothetical protein